MKAKLFGTVIELSYTLTAAITAVIILDGSSSVFICLLSALMHELGHIMMLRHFGAMPERIKLSLFDAAIIDRKKALRKNNQELFVILAGIAVNYISAAIGMGIYHFVKQDWMMTFVTAHLTLGIFNSLPVDSLDGGQAILIILTSRFSQERAETILVIISIIVIVPIACGGFLLLFYTRYNFTLLLAAMYLTALLFLKNKKRLLRK